MSRIQGLTYLDFQLANLANESHRTSSEGVAQRKTLVTDIANQVLRSHVQIASESGRDLSHLPWPEIFRGAASTLECLATALPKRLYRHVPTEWTQYFLCPWCFFMETLENVTLWWTRKLAISPELLNAKAEICPFGMNLHRLQALSGHLHIRDGWKLYNDHNDLQSTFWDTFAGEAGLGDSKNDVDTIRIIKVERAVGLLLSRGFTSRLANQPKPVPISDNESRRYNMLWLSGIFINPASRMEHIE